jgi:hypothetical protein
MSAIDGAPVLRPYFTVDDQRMARRRFPNGPNLPQAREINLQQLEHICASMNQSLRHDGTLPASA